MSKSLFWVLLRYFCGIIFRFRIFLLRYVLIHYLLLLDHFLNNCSFRCYLVVFHIILHSPSHPAPLSSAFVITISSIPFTSSSGFCSFSERLEHFGCFSFLIVTSVSLFVVFINVSTGWCFLEGSRYLLNGFQIFLLQWNEDGLQRL